MNDTSLIISILRGFQALVSRRCIVSSVIHILSFSGNANLIRVCKMWKELLEDYERKDRLVDAK